MNISLLFSRGFIPSLAAGSLFLLLPLAHAADVDQGSEVFDSQCAECHSVKAGKNKKGPSLFGIVGRKSASVTDFTYSDAMKASGTIWSPDKIEAYLASPKTAVPGGKMKYDKKLTAPQTADLLAFLVSLH